MPNLKNMLWIELRKALRSRVPIFTTLGFLIVPLACSFLMFIYKDPEFARQAGLVGAKANLIGGEATWPFYLNMFSQAIASGGIMLYILIIAWVFGREFSDGTAKDMLSVPIPRTSWLLAKFIVAGVWSIAATLLILFVGLILGAAIGMPGGSPEVLGRGLLTIILTVGLVLLVTIPFGFFASIGRGYLFPLGMAVLTVALANLVALIGYGEAFPWAVPALFAGMVGPETHLQPASYLLVIVTGAAGMALTFGWWLR
ncbi:MAG: ABC transporter permease, partial [Anaerolineae bacterium]|nr:ABC transporter permease [Anaerolineae bacterium]